jgi:hypothetical protein
MANSTNQRPPDARQDPLYERIKDIVIELIERDLDVERALNEQVERMIRRELSDGAPLG